MLWFSVLKIAIIGLEFSEFTKISQFLPVSHQNAFKQYWNSSHLDYAGHLLAVFLFSHFFIIHKTFLFYCIMFHNFNFVYQIIFNK